MQIIFSALIIEYSGLKFKGILMSEKLLSIVILNDHLSIYEYQNNIWESMPIKGEHNYEHQHDISCLNTSILELNARMNQDDNLAQYKITILYIQPKASWLGNTLSILTEHYQCTRIQVLGYETIIDTVEDSNYTDISKPAWISQYVLPTVIVKSNSEQIKEQEQLLNNKLTSLQKALDDDKNSLYQEYDEQTSQLNTEKQKLLEQINELRTQITNANTPNLENLISYLPVIFKDFWNIVPPIELANIAGKINPPNIPSPYHSPSEQAVALQKRKFDSLDENTQKSIITFGIQLSQHYSLKPHRTFSRLFMEF